MIFLFNWVIFRLHVNFQGVYSIFIYFWEQESQAKPSFATSQHAGARGAPIQEVTGWRWEEKKKQIRLLQRCTLQSGLRHQLNLHVTPTCKGYLVHPSYPLI